MDLLLVMILGLVIWFTFMILAVIMILKTWLVVALKCYSARTEAIRDNWEPEQNK